MCLCVYSSFSSHISETSEAIAIKFDTVTVSVTGMHHVLIMLTLSFITGHTYLNHGNNNCTIILETVQAMRIMLDVKIVSMKVGRQLLFNAQSTILVISGRISMKVQFIGLKTDYIDRCVLNLAHVLLIL